MKLESEMTNLGWTPMLAHEWDARALRKGEWSYEIKYDGVRAIMSIDVLGTRIFNRSGDEITNKYPELASIRLPFDDNYLLLDGEIIATDDFGTQSFQSLQGRMNLQNSMTIANLSDEKPVEFVAFDILICDVGNYGRAHMTPWVSRRASLSSLFDAGILQHPIIEPLTMTNKGAITQYARENDLEGIMAKNHVSIYKPGTRSRGWMKLPFTRRARAVVGGFTAGTGKRSEAFGGLVLGMYNDVNNGKLIHVGSVGTGFNDTTLQYWTRILHSLESETCPFDLATLTQPNARWVKPTVVIQVQFRNWTNGWHLRMPSYKGVDDTIATKVTFNSEHVKR